MNTLSKVFVVLNLLFALAFCFMTLTLYAKRVDWKDKFQKESYAREEDNKESERKIVSLEAKYTGMREERDAAVRNSNEATETALNAEQERKNAVEEREQAKAKNVLLTNRIAVKDEELTRRYEQIERMHRIVALQQKAVEVARANALNASHQRMEMEVELNNSRAQLVAVRKEKARLEKDLHHSNWIIVTLRKHGVNVEDFISIAGYRPDLAIHGKVLAVRPDVNIVMLSVGSDDKVKRGYRFTVYRGEKYIGKVRVEKVFRDMSAAKILADWTKEAIKEEDDVATGSD